MKSVAEIERDLLRDIVGDVTKWHAGAANVSEVGLLRSMLYDMVRNHAELTYRLADVQETAEHANKLLREAVEWRDALKVEHEAYRANFGHTHQLLKEAVKESDVQRDVAERTKDALIDLQRRYNELAIQVECTQAERNLAQSRISHVTKAKEVYRQNAANLEVELEKATKTINSAKEERDDLRARLERTQAERNLAEYDKSRLIQEVKVLKEQVAYLNGHRATVSTDEIDVRLERAAR
jgi:chromosome segregation ATPase